MIYSRYPHTFRRFSYPANVPASNYAVSDSPEKSEKINIPMPNEREVENFPDACDTRGSNNRSLLLSMRHIIMRCLSRVGIEELLLIVLILLLLDEKTEDEYLPVILLYILISGFQ